MPDKNHDHDEEMLEDESRDVDLEVEEIEGKTTEKIQELRAKLQRCEDERRQFQEDLLRLKADFLNSKRRLEEQLERDKERSAERILTELLAVIDSFEMAMRHTTAGSDSTQKGIEAIYGQFLSFLRSQQIEEIGKKGELFDPSQHEAISNITVTDDSEINKIMEVLQKGYRRKEAILRPARVVVGTKD